MTEPNVYERIKMREYFLAVSGALTDLSIEAIDAIVQKIRRTKKYLGTVWIAGNGGSAATASHFANDLVKMAGVKAIALSDMTPTTLAYMNDDGARVMFAKPSRVLIEMHDLIFLISCSGNSANIFELAKDTDRPVILLTGDKQGFAYKYANLAVNVQSPDIRVQEDVHLAICHNIVGLLRG